MSSEAVKPPNGPDGGKNPLTNQFAYFNIPGWWDDTCGGEIDVTVTLKDGSVLSTRDNVKSATDEGTRNPNAGAWIVTAPPKFATHMSTVVSILEDWKNVVLGKTGDDSLDNGGKRL